MGNMIFDQLWSTPYNKTVFRSDLIRWGKTNFRQPEDRQMTAEYDPIGHRLTYDVAEALTAENFTILKDGDVEIDDQIFWSIWDERRYQDMWNEVITQSLIHGSCVLELFDEAPFWMVHSGSQITEVKYSDKLVVNACSVRKTINGHNYQTTLQFPSNSCLWIQFRPTDDSKGRSILKSVWDAMIYMRLCVHNMGQYDSRLGSGFPVLKLGDVSSDVAQKLKEGMDKIDSKNGIVIPLDAELDLKGVSSSSDFPSHFDELYKQIAAGSGFTMKYFNGESKGAVLASEEEGKLIRSRITQIFGHFKPYIKSFIRILWHYTNIDVHANIIVSLDEEEAKAMEDDLDEANQNKEV